MSGRRKSSWEADNKPLVPFRFLCVKGVLGGWKQLRDCRRSWTQDYGAEFRSLVFSFLTPGLRGRRMAGMPLMYDH